MYCEGVKTKQNCLEESYFSEERHFVLRLMSFIYGVSGAALQHCLQERLHSYPREKEGYFNKIIARAILIYLIDYMDSDETLVDLASQAYQTKIEELTKMYSPSSFLKFLAQYILKSKLEYYENNLFDSPIKCFSSIVRFLDEMRKIGRCDARFWQNLNETAAEIIAKEFEIIECQKCELTDTNGEIDMPSEKEFILVVTNTIYSLYSRKLPDYLRRDLDRFSLVSQNEFDPIIEVSLSRIKENIEEVVNYLGNDSSVYEYFFQLCTNSFSGRHFLEFCVCSTRKALFEYYIKMIKNSPLKAYECLVKKLETAKRDGKFHSMKDFISGANEIIKDYNKRTEARAQRDASTGFGHFSSSTKLKSNRGNLFASCESKQSDANPVTENVTISKENAQPVIEKLAIPGESVQQANDTENSSELEKGSCNCCTAI